MLTCQRIVDVVFHAFQACAASQGCMNNTTFGDDSEGYYETVAGGAGAVCNVTSVTKAGQRCLMAIQSTLYIAYSRSVILFLFSRIMNAMDVCYKSKRSAIVTESLNYGGIPSYDSHVIQ